MTVLHTIVAALATAVIVWSLWARNITWSCRRDSAATLAVASFGASLWLVAPSGTWTIGVALHAITGIWNLDYLLGHCFAILSAAAMTTHALDRVHDDDDDLQNTVSLWIAPFVTIVVAGMCAAFWLSGLKSTTDFYAQTGPWVTVYWLLLAGLLAYLLGYKVRVLLILRGDADHRTVADLYLLTCVFGVLTSVARILTVLPPAEIGFHPLVMRTLATLWMGSYAVVTIYSWRLRTRRFAKLAKAVKARV